MEPKPRPRNDAYTGLLALSFLALAGGCVLLFLDYNQYPKSKPDEVRIAPPGRGETRPQPTLAVPPTPAATKTEASLAPLRRGPAVAERPAPPPVPPAPLAASVPPAWPELPPPPQ